MIANTNKNNFKKPYANNGLAGFPVKHFLQTFRRGRKYCKNSTVQGNVWTLTEICSWWRFAFVICTQGLAGARRMSATWPTDRSACLYRDTGAVLNSEEWLHHWERSNFPRVLRVCLGRAHRESSVTVRCFHVTREIFTLCRSIVAGWVAYIFR